MRTETVAASEDDADGSDVQAATGEEEPEEEPEPEKPTSSGGSHQPKTDVDINEKGSLFDL